MTYHTDVIRLLEMPIQDVYFYFENINRGLVGLK